MSPRGIRILARISSLPGIFDGFGWADRCRWGSMSYLDLTEEDIGAAQTELDTPHHTLGQLVFS
jgi:hypothetical protein